MKQEKQKKSENKRSKVEHPNLKKEYNLKSRRYYIETDYVDGVYGSNKEILIRPLNQEEKDWLDKFYSEYINANLSGEDTLHTVDRSKNKKVKAKIEKLKQKRTKTQSRKEKKKITEEAVALRDEYYYTDHVKSIEGANNARNRDLYNIAHKLGKLKEVDPRAFDNIKQYDFESSVNHLYLHKIGKDFDEGDNSED